MNRKEGSRTPLGMPWRLVMIPKLWQAEAGRVASFVGAARGVRATRSLLQRRIEQPAELPRVSVPSRTLHTRQATLTMTIPRRVFLAGGATAMAGGMAATACSGGDVPNDLDIIDCHTHF